MDCYIKQIIIFNSNGEKRNVPLEPGLNIITGDSQTGKSALLEIVDYCLCSKMSSIPKGEISEFGYLYAIVLAFPKKYIVLGRKRFSEGGKNQVYIKTESNGDFLNNLSLDYFNKQNAIQVENAKNEIASHFGMAVRNMAESDNANDWEKRTASIREMASFWFQHQNLIANKHALFYRFDDYYKKQATIDSFPVFAGWVGDEYFSLKREKESLEKQLRQISNSKRKQDEIDDKVKNELIEYFKSYYALIGVPFDTSLSIQQLIGLRNKLPDYSSKTFISQEVLNRHSLLNKERDDKKISLDDINRKIKDIEDSQRYARDYQLGLSGLNFSLIAIDEHQEYNCPICGKNNEELQDEFQKIKISNERLSLELQKVSNYTASYSKEEEELKTQRADLLNEIKIINDQLEEIEKNVKEVQIEKNTTNKIIYAKAKLDLRIDLVSKGRKIVDDADVEGINKRLENIKHQLSRYSINSAYQRAEDFINNNMNKIANKLDFEEELKPIKLMFGLQKFTLIHDAQHNIGKISINEMGSGANWLACHLALSMSLLHYFAREPKAVIPSFLFIDQPSQVYFPKEFDPNEDEDIKQVSKIYIAILEELEEIKKATGFLPQVIVTDHADNLVLGKFKFTNYVRRRWTNSQALI